MKLEEVTKVFLLSVDVHRSTVKQIVYKLRKFSTAATFPRSGNPTKLTAQAQLRLLNTSKTLNKNGVHWRKLRRKPLISNKNMSEVCKRASRCSTALLAKYSVDRWDQRVVWKKHTTLCVEEKKDSIPTSKPHLNCEVW